jgi:glycosyltransferase involved in cell wall biosynthesis
MKGIDTTPEIVKKFAESDPRIVAVVREKEGMMGWDMRTGLNQATGETIAVIDGDGQMPPEDIIKVYDALILNKSDIAKTYREHRFDGFKRILISRVYNFLFRILFPKARVRDVNSKPKIFTREALSKLNLTSDGWFIDAEMIINAGRLGLTISEVPTDFYVNENRDSFIGFAAILEFIKNLFIFKIRSK